MSKRKQGFHYTSSDSSPSSYPFQLDDDACWRLESEDSEEVQEERALWRAVITQALMDAGSNSNKKEAKLEKARAIAWLSGGSEDFKYVCALAEMDPYYVQEKAKEAIKRGCKWRKEGARKKKQKRVSEKCAPKEEITSLPILIFKRRANTG